jgi:hypothetical protein
VQTILKLFTGINLISVCCHSNFGFIETENFLGLSQIFTKMVTGSKANWGFAEQFPVREFFMGVTKPTFAERFPVKEIFMGVTKPTFAERFPVKEIFMGVTKPTFAERFTVSWDLVKFQENLDLDKF